MGIEALRRDLGLDEPAIWRFFDWLSGAVVGDFGLTFIDKTPVTTVGALVLSYPNDGIGVYQISVIARTSNE